MAGSLRQQLNGDLLLAMKAKDAIAISALRSVLSALDNASAVPANTVAAPVYGRNGDVPRRDLSDSDCQGIVRAEASSRALAAEEYTRLGREDVAARLRAEQAVVERYAKGGTQKEIEAFAKRRAAELKKISDQTEEPGYLASGTQTPAEAKDGSS